MRRLFAALALLPAAGATGAYTADAAALSFARGLSEVASILRPSAAQPALVYVESDADFAPADPKSAAVTHVATKGGGAPAPKTAARKGVRVSAERVLRLANAGARPSGVFVSARGDRPAGLALVGVSGLGIGLIDGDVLTHAGGRPATSAGAVIGMVIGARAKRIPELSGRFWRKGESWNLLVEQPYVNSARRADELALATVSREPLTSTGTGPSPSTARAYSAPP